MEWRRGTGIEPAWTAVTQSTLDLKSRPGTSRGNLAASERSSESTTAIPGSEILWRSFEGAHSTSNAG
jgi:hypothetical protein